MGDCSLRCIIIGAVLGFGLAVVLAFVNRYFIGPLLAPFKPQSVSQKTAKTPWQMIVRAVWSIAGGVAIIGIILVLSAPEQQEEILAAFGDLFGLALNMIGKLVRLLLELGRGLAQVILNLVRDVAPTR